MGRLSNPPEPVETLVGQGVMGSCELLGRVPESLVGSACSSRSRRLEETGQLSNPARDQIQRRLTDADVDELVARHRAGQSLPAHADRFGVHRRTVAAHLERRGVQRRVNLRKMTDDDITDASHRHLLGDSFATIGRARGVDAATVRRELVRDGITIRPRRGN